MRTYRIIKMRSKSQNRLFDRVTGAEKEYLAYLSLIPKCRIPTGVRMISSAYCWGRTGGHVFSNQMTNMTQIQLHVDLKTESIILDYQQCKKKFKKLLERSNKRARSISMYIKCASYHTLPTYTNIEEMLYLILLNLSLHNLLMEVRRYFA